MIRNTLRARRGSLALAIALATGAAATGGMLASPAMAAPKAPKTSYSKEFIAVYKPLNDQLTGEAPDLAAIKAALPSAVAAAKSADEQFAVGGLLFTVGQKADDVALRMQGLELILNSGKLPAENKGPYSFQAGAFAYQLKDYDKARTYMQAALDAGYTENEPEAFIAETYFTQDRTKEGLAYLSGVIDARRSAGLPIKEEWLKRGLSVAYKGQLSTEANKFGALLVESYPSETTWADAVAIALNTGGYQNPEILDLMRLARRAGGLRDERMYLEYTDAADYKKLPAEVVALIDEGYAKGKIAKSNGYVTDTRAQAVLRAAADEKDLASMLSAGKAASADFKTVMAAGDLMLSKGNAKAAEEFYAKALASAGASTPMVLTRLGIAQSDQGKLAEAQATFAKVEGARQAIANLWKIYLAQKIAGTN